MKAFTDREIATAAAASVGGRRGRRRDAGIPWFLSTLVAGLVAAIGFSNVALAQTLWKAGNDDNLNLTSSWFTTEAGPTNPASIATSSTLRFGGSGQGATGRFRSGVI